MAELKPKLAELFDFMDATRASLIATVRDMNNAFAEMRPRDGSWSASEILAHLAIVESRVVKMVNNGIEAARRDGIGPDTSDQRIVGSLSHLGVVDSPKKLVAPPAIVPERPEPIEKSMASLDESRNTLKKILIENQDIDLHSVKRPHPAFKDLDMYQWALFAAEHEERHRRQIERTLGEVTELCAESAPIV